jgi:hypothetical protein
VSHRALAARARSSLPAALLLAAVPLSAGPAPPEGGPAPAGAPAAVGERPEGRTADQTFLRDQAVLLRGGGQTLELDLDYQRSEPVLGSARVLSVQAAYRVGVANDVQLSARLPWRTQRIAGPAGERLDDRSAFGDLSLGLFAVALRERAGRPNVVVSLDGVAPTGPGDAGVGGGLAFTKSHDPVVLFCGASYLYGLRTNTDNPGRALARHNVGLNLGYAFAVNESVALTGQVAGSIRSVRAGREQYRLRLGVTYLVTPRLFVEPTVSASLGTAAPDVTFGLSIPWTP